MNHPRVWQAIIGSEWAIRDGESLSAIMDIASRAGEIDIEAVEKQIGRPLQNTETAYTRDGVAVIPVVGPTLRRANLFSRISGATSYDIVARDLNAAIEDPDVSAIVLNIDSQGGMANGVAELASHIREAGERKPVVAYVGGQAASAAYWLAASASRIVIERTALAGSIGVVVGIGKPPAEGERRAQDIVSSQSPYKRVDPHTKEGRERVQALVDNLASIFIEDVAEFRGVTVDTVLADFGKGDVLIGQAAVDAGMADAIGTFEGVIASLTTSSTPPVAGRSIAATTEVSTMDIATLKEQHGDLYAQIVEDAQAAVEIPDVAAERETATTAERDRVLGIITSDAAKGREQLAMALAKRPGMTAEDAAEILAASPAQNQSKGTGFEQHMQALGNPEIEGDPEGAADASNDFEDPAQAVAFARQHGAIN